jgi:hypothetical protein
MKVQLSQNPDVLGKFGVQNRNQLLKIYQKWLSLHRGKERIGLWYEEYWKIWRFLKNIQEYVKNM